MIAFLFQNFLSNLSAEFPAACGGGECGKMGKGVGETGVSLWRRAVSEASVENREVLKMKIPRQLAARRFMAGVSKLN